MTSDIRLLDKKIYDKIAAGEVVTDTLSVVKELLENSIDAGSSRISVSISGGGLASISVKDNGRGILREQLELAFTAHATSKISSVSDLNHIDSLGFRGEALASIGAVSRVEMTSKTADETRASVIRCEGGVISEIRDTGAPDGTQIVVRDLFYNTPARLKFQKSEKSVNSAVTDFVAKMSICYPKIAFSMEYGANRAFTTSGKGDVREAILTVYGDLPSSKLLLVDTSYVLDNKELMLHAYISATDETKKSKKSQLYFVNGRLIKDNGLISAVNSAYEGRIMPGRYPSVYLFLEIDPVLLDVNVHPSKSEIRFSEPKAVYDFVNSSISEAISGVEALPQIRDTAMLKQKSRQYRALFALKTEINETEIPTSAGMTTDVIASTVSEHGTGSAAVDCIAAKAAQSSQDTYQRFAFANRVRGSKQSSNVAYPDVTDEIVEVDINKLWLSQVADISSDNSSYNSVGLQKQISVIETDSEVSPRITDENSGTLIDIGNFNVIGTLFSTYILVSDVDCLYIIDQHAAHERVNYEKLLSLASKPDKPVQELLTPYVVDLPTPAVPLMDSWTELLSSYGFESRIFGERAIAISTFPAFLSMAEAEIFMNDIIEAAGANIPENERAMERLIAKACRSSIKANDQLDIIEIQALLTSLAACDNPYNCPHGRPVFIRMTKYELEHSFGRV